MDESRKQLLQHPTDVINGFQVRPGYYTFNGAFEIPGGVGVNFTVHSFQATACTLVLFHNREDEPYALIPFPEDYCIGNTYSMIVYDLNISELEYAYQFDGPFDPKKGLIFDKRKFILDPYARAVAGQRLWGEKQDEGFFYKARVVRSEYDWGKTKQPQIPFDDLIIYEAHVRGFTEDKSSRVKNKGTFAGIREKIPYLLSLGVNAVELMPVFEFDEMEDSRVVDGKQLYNYWGYSPVCFFAPNTSYSSMDSHNREGLELKKLIRELNQNGIEVILDVVFNHTAEGNEKGPFFSFKGIDNNIYYMLTPDGHYYNFSGCGNVLNCNQPIVQQMILECLRYWTINYRVDGFRFDLASILGRNEDGSPMSDPPLLQSLAFDPILGKVKLIAEAWDAGGLYQVGSFPSWNRWAEWNGRYRDDMRSFLKGDNGYAGAAIARMSGSKDIYDPKYRGENATVNFINCHDGFTLYDMYSYNTKHNEKNGWNNEDGESNNRSWNCGVEGETDDPAVNALRLRMCKNAFAALMCSHGAVMFLAGDEFCNTQFGNNNAYCQDNITSWLDWSRREKYGEMYEFAKEMIRFRKGHPVLRKTTEESRCGFPDISVHNDVPWNAECRDDTHCISLMYAGRKKDQEEDDIVYVAVNTYWEDLNLTLPELPVGLVWKIKVDTAAEYDPAWKSWKLKEMTEEYKTVISQRSVLILVAEKR